MTQAISNLISPMPGKVVAILVNVGDAVESGQELIALESMKMEVPIKTDAAGVVKAIKVKIDDKVMKGDVLVELA